MEKSTRPATQDLEQALGDSFEVWRALSAFAYRSSPGAVEEWKYGNTKTGWGFKITHRRKVLVALMPHDKFFQASFMFAEKAADAVLTSDVSDQLKAELKAAKVGLEGRALKVEARDRSALDDLKKLIAAQVGN